MIAERNKQHDRCAGLTEPQSCALKDLAEASSRADDGWCTAKQIWPTPGPRELTSLKTLVAKTLVEIDRFLPVPCTA